MSKIRINDLARELEVKSKEILDALTTVGVTEKKTHSSSLEDHEAELVRKHLRGRSDAAPSSAKPSRAASHGEEEIKTKIDLSNISRPGDVLRAITQQKGAVEQPAPRPAASRRRDASGGSQQRSSSCQRRRRQCRPSPRAKRPRRRAENGDACFGSCHLPAAVGGRDSTESSARRRPRRTPAASVSTAPPCYRVPPRAVATPPQRKLEVRHQRRSLRPGIVAQMQSAAPRKAGGSDCAAAANDHAADRTAPGIQGASAPPGSACGECAFASDAWTTSAGPANFSAHGAARKRRERTSAASSGRTAADASDACGAGGIASARRRSGSGRWRRRDRRVRERVREVRRADRDRDMFREA